MSVELIGASLVKPFSPKADKGTLTSYGWVCDDPTGSDLTVRKGKGSNTEETGRIGDLELEIQIVQDPIVQKEKG